jgi:hypothetical protein
VLLVASVTLDFDLGATTKRSLVRDLELDEEQVEVDEMEVGVSIPGTTLNTYGFGCGGTGGTGTRLAVRLALLLGKSILPGVVAEVEVVVVVLAGRLSSVSPCRPNSFHISWRRSACLRIRACCPSTTRSRWSILLNIVSNQGDRDQGRLVRVREMGWLIR